MSPEKISYVFPEILIYLCSQNNMYLNPTYQDGPGLFQKSFLSNIYIYISSIYIYITTICVI